MAASLTLQHRGQALSEHRPGEEMQRESTCGVWTGPWPCAMGGSLQCWSAAFPSNRRLGFGRALVSACLSTACASAARWMLTPTDAGVRPWVNAQALEHAMLLYLPLYLDT